MADEARRAAEESRIQKELKQYALPDSRFQYDLNCFIPSFEGNAEATQRAVATPGFANASLLFVTPDNALKNYRAELIAAGKAFLIPTYGLERGFLLVEPTAAMREMAELASSLDGIEHFGHQIKLADIAKLGKCDLIVAGTSAVSMDGVRFGMGYHYLDAELLLLDAVGFTSKDTDAITIVHDCQVSAECVKPTSGHVRVRTAFTPAKKLELNIQGQHRDVGAPQIPEPLCNVNIFKELAELHSAV